MTGQELMLRMSVHKVCFRNDCNRKQHIVRVLNLIFLYLKVKVAHKWQPEYIPRLRCYLQCCISSGDNVNIHMPLYFCGAIITIAVFPFYFLFG